MNAALDKKSWKLLKKLYKKKQLTYEDVSEITGTTEDGEDRDSMDRHSKEIKKLKANSFIEDWHGPIRGGYADEWFGYRITLDGKAYVEQRRRDWRKTWIPVAVAAVVGLLTFLAALIN